ncbi:MAG: Lrp/AsnC family transcriptional regulator, partial [Proteobacteria bacterium]
LGHHLEHEIHASGHGVALQHLRVADDGFLEFGQVLECYTMAGGMDFMLKVVAKDIASYERFLRDHLLQKPHVQEAYSNIAMSEVKRTTELPLE